ncbi:MAG TPA: hypothetical protein VMU36_03365 [Spirochaetia bacterium]|nr:hypothetical protein [Spirochaetia bacterium]
MTKGTRGTVVSVHAELLKQRLKVVATIRTDSGATIDAHMPDREISAILPRSVLLGQARTAPPSLLDTLTPILARMTEGRLVRVWQYRERWFFSFQQWKGVRFLEAGEESLSGGLTGDEGRTAMHA